MNYFYIEPEVAGGLGPDTAIDRTGGSFIVTKLNYQFDGWLGDVLLASHPCYVVTEQAKQALDASGISGAKFGEVKVTTSDEFDERHPDVRLPKFAWLKVEGEPGRYDFGMAANGKLVASNRALEVLLRLGIPNAIVTPFEGDGAPSRSTRRQRRRQN